MKRSLRNNKLKITNMINMNLLENKKIKIIIIINSNKHKKNNNNKTK
jgi:hypothetical protein